MIQKNTTGYIKAIANAYIILITAVLPLYMREGMVLIGDAKYGFYLTAAFLCLAASIPGLIILISLKNWNRKRKWSWTDCCVLLFGAVTLLSFMVSAYQEVAFWGYKDWYMGLVTQFLFVWSYFLVSRYWSGEKNYWILAGAVSAIVFIIGVLNRYQYDPLGVFDEIGKWEWNRIHLLSTIGNINWYCGYVSLLLPLSWYWFWKEERWKRLLGMLGSLLGLLTLFTQGSESGYAGMTGMLIVLLWCSLRNTERLIRFLQTILLIPITPIVITYSIHIMPRGLMLSDDGQELVVFWKGWWWILLLVLAVLGIALYQHKKSMRDFLQITWIHRTIKLCLLLSMGGLILLFLLCQWSEFVWGLFGNKTLLRIDADWGNGRGALWNAAVQCFLQGDWKQRILGAGPDCFACIIYEKFDLAGQMHITGQWQGAIFANAHNEWLNMLVTQGLLGAISYLGIFVSSFWQFARKENVRPIMVLGMMLIAAYFMNNIFSFQQIVVTPIMFVFLGIMQYYGRENE